MLLPRSWLGKFRGVSAIHLMVLPILHRIDTLIALIIGNFYENLALLHRFAINLLKQKTRFKGIMTMKL